jgi:pimeloyl-ACP methyl ester carboxylesterase
VIGNYTTSTRSIAVNGVDLVVHECDDRAQPAVVLSHGFPELAFSRRHRMVPLADADYHVIAPDQRSYGHSSSPSDIAAYDHAAPVATQQ